MTIAWIRSAIERSGSGISAIFASRSFSPSAFELAAFASRARSFIAARSSAVKPPDALVVFFVSLAMRFLLCRS